MPEFQTGIEQAYQTDSRDWFGDHHGCRGRTRPSRRIQSHNVSPGSVSSRSCPFHRHPLKSM